MIYTGKQTVFNLGGQLSLERLILNEEEASLTKREEGKSSYSFKLAKYLTSTGIGEIFEALNAFLSLSMSILYAVDSYYYPQGVYVLNLIELILLWFFIIHFLLNLYISENKLLFAFTSLSILEYISIIPTFLIRIGAIDSSDVLLLTRIFRFLLIYRIDRILARRSKEVTKYVFRLIFTIFSILMIGASCLLVVERANAVQGNFDINAFHDWFYFMVVTVTTVGYGDVYPRTSIGQLFVMASISISLSLIPTQTQDLARVANLQSKYARISFKQGGKYSDQHLLLLGKPLIEGFKTFLNEFYHNDHGDTDIKAVIMQQDPPDEDMMSILKDKKIGDKIVYLEGSALNSRDLERASTDGAKCVIILADKHSKEPNKEDYKNILHASAVKQHVKSALKRDIRICLQVLKPENKELYGLSSNHGSHDQVICVDELKLYLLAKTCICPGINTIISTLITSAKPAPATYLQSWVNEYLNGLQNEIYRIPLEGHKYAGLTFATISKYLYQYDITLFAVEVNVGGVIRVFVNPSDYVFLDSNHYGYVFADSLPDIEKLSKIRIPDNISRNFSSFNNGNNGKMYEDEKHKKIKNEMDDEVNEMENKMKNFYHGKINSLESATLSGNEDVKFENHIIICGIVPGMRHLLLPLRARSLKTIYPIIILYNDPMPTYIWKQINRFPKVHFMHGSPQKLIDLDRACIQKALAVVILSKQGDQENNGTTSMADADTIFVYKTIKSVNPNVRIITELTSTSTISFLSHNKTESLQKIGYMASEPFAAGEIYISTMLDTLICQAYYNPFITSILDQFIMGTSMLNYKSRKIYNNYKLNSSSLYLMNIPVKFIEKYFGEMYEGLISDSKMIAVGIYRERNKGTSRYVLIKPDPKIKLQNKDKVFVLSQKQPKNSELTTFEDEENKDLPKLLAEGAIVNIKSKLGGEEGRIDTEIAKELLNVNHDMRGIISELKGINKEIFSKGFTNQNFVPEIRKSLRDSLGKFSQGQS